ncbi:MAG: endonuclease III domain-containing protein [Desulfuromusa sp.]|nr:endonuclease III domain-containing protein [Desulfuromusa sp.]
MPDLLHIYQTLLDHYGPRDWWPAKTPFEVVVGAILTQNTNWKNVEKAIANLQQADVLTLEAILNLEREKLEQLIRPSGFFRQKAERLQLFCRYLQEHHQGKLDRLFDQDLNPVREELLSLNGIGPETADSILLYAGQLPSFVVDAYTNRLFRRIGILSGTEKYAEVRDLFMSHLPEEIQLYNEYHALIVIHCKDFCRKKPLCNNCPCADICLANC